MAIAQAFAGPPGPGRRPGEFAAERERGANAASVVADPSANRRA